MLNVKQICAAVTGLLLSSGTVWSATCADLEKQGLTYENMKSTLSSVVSLDNGGLGFPMWLTLVDGSGIICNVTNSLSASQDVTADIWLGSRNISAQKANAANAFSTGDLALSTANLYTATQPSGSLYGLQASNPIDPTLSYGGSAVRFGAKNDPLKGKRIGGINVFGGGLHSTTPPSRRSVRSAFRATPPAQTTSWPGKCANCWRAVPSPSRTSRPAFPPATMMR